jgi:hypothetical protein
MESEHAQPVSAGALSEHVILPCATGWSLALWPGVEALAALPDGPLDAGGARAALAASPASHAMRCVGSRSASQLLARLRGATCGQRAGEVIMAVDKDAAGKSRQMLPTELWPLFIFLAALHAYALVRMKMSNTSEITLARVVSVLSEVFWVDGNRFGAIPHAYITQLLTRRTTEQGPGRAGATAGTAKAPAPSGGTGGLAAAAGDSYPVAMAAVPASAASGGEGFTCFPVRGVRCRRQYAAGALP